MDSSMVISEVPVWFCQQWNKNKEFWYQITRKEMSKGWRIQIVLMVLTDLEYQQYSRQKKPQNCKSQS